MLLMGIGGAGSAAAKGVSRAFGEGLRSVMIDTDASTGDLGGNFILIGGDHLSGRGAGGDVVAARYATEDSGSAIDPVVEGVRLAVIVTSLGGGTGSGATLEILKRLGDRGIRTIVFATTPFAFEGPDRLRTAQSVMSLIEDAANAAFFLPLDQLVDGTDNMDEALRRAIDTLASAITLFWRLVEKPGYLRLDAERIGHIISKAGRGRFATVTAQGPNRAADVIDALSRAPALAGAGGGIRSILCGILAGEDLRLSEVGRIADGVRTAFGSQAAFELATVNDEMTFTGRLAVVVMLFEENGQSADPADEVHTTAPAKPRRGGRRNARSALSVGPQGRGRFNNAEPTVWHDEDLDIPTYIRKKISLDF